LIKPDFASDVIFGVDQEFIDGIKSPLYVKGGDWMSSGGAAAQRHYMGG
jgi:hypothetical protein